MKHLDLCCGTGGFTLACKLACKLASGSKIKTVYANDILKDSECIYGLNFNNVFQLKDLNTIQPEHLPKHDILTAGFPCQSFSIAGKRLGFKDDRSQVFWKIVEILQYHKPKFFILENVKNLTSHDGGNTFKIISSNLEKLGYHLKYKVLNTSNITGIPQNRERIYIVGFLDQKLCENFSLDFDEIPKNPISDYLEEDIVDDKYYYTDKYACWKIIKDMDFKKNTVYQFRRVYVRENKKGECPTLTANMGKGGHNVPLIKDTKGIRKLTPSECFKLQGFENYNLPKNLSDSKLYSLAGNAITVNIAKMIIERLITLK